LALIDLDATGGKGVEGLTLEKIAKSQYLKLALLGALGVILIVLGSIAANPKERAGGQSLREMDVLKKYEEDLAREIERVVSAIEGVGKVSASVTVESGPENVFAENVTRSSSSQIETGREGITRESISQNETTQPVSGRISSGETPLVERVIGTKVAGCLVVAEGASSSDVKLKIYRAVETLLDIPIYKIQVTPMKGGK
jgi:stage III sporulation protein AG